MGMSFPNGGSASYPRFDSMLRRIATAFGATEKTVSKDYSEAVQGKLDWWFGTINRRDDDQKFDWPSDTPWLVRAFVEDPYFEHSFGGMMDPSQAKELLKSLLEKFPYEEELEYEGQDAIVQILAELKTVVENDEGFYLIP